MTKAGVRGPLKQVRLGAVQKKVLVILLGVQLRLERSGETFKGMPYKEIHARLYNQAVIVDGQWLQTVHAQQLLEHGETQAANQVLLRGIDLAATEVAAELQFSLRSENPMEIETRLLLTNVLNEVFQIQNTASLLQHAQTPNDQDALYTTLLSLARGVGSFVRSGLLTSQGREKFLTLSDDEKAAALKVVNVQQASLSRALRGLLESKLIQQQEEKITRFGQNEKRYYITNLGLQRLRLIEQKT